MRQQPDKQTPYDQFNIEKAARRLMRSQRPALSSSRSTTTPTTPAPHSMRADSVMSHIDKNDLDHLAAMLLLMMAEGRSSKRDL